MERFNPQVEVRLLREVVAHYLGSSTDVTFITRVWGGGFSGARLWRVTRGTDQYCLRRWPPEHPSRERLQFIHSVLRHVYDHGVIEIALPLADFTGQTILHEDGSLWELAHWKPGSADYHESPTPGKLSGAMQVLARFHLAARSFYSAPKYASPAGLVSRSEQLAQLISGGFEHLRLAVNSNLRPDVFGMSQQILAWFPAVASRLRQQLESACRQQVPLQPCIRDVWHDHILFTQEQVTGLVDFGALREDHVAGDIARLLSSLVRNDEHAWRKGLAAYESLNPLSPVERDLIDVYDLSATLLSGINWLDWLYVQGRQFDGQRVQQRLIEITNRMGYLFH